MTFKRGDMNKLWRNNGLTITLMGLFLVFQLGLSSAGFQHYNQEQIDHNQPTLSYPQYLGSASFLEATMENWESEFLQMFGYVALTVFLFQKGSSESKDPDEEEAVDRDPEASKHKADAPWPVRKGGFALTVYKYSLSLALLLLFIFSFALHAVGGVQLYNEEQLLHGGQTVTTLGYLLTAQFWFESLQNWQSEFFSIGIMVLLSIWLRQRGSPESKPVDSPHSFTGTE
jgi:hypothetical protein